MVELSSKFGADPGEAVDLIAAAFDLGLVVEGCRDQVDFLAIVRPDFRGGLAMEPVFGAH